MTIKVYGVRTCIQCKGICHENSLRCKIGIRKNYYCCESCLKQNNDIREFYEVIDVITA